MDKVLCHKNECHALGRYRHETGSLIRQSVQRKKNPPGSTATFLTGINLPIRDRYPLEGAGLVHSHDREEKPARLTIEPYLATHMNRRRTHVVIFLSMSHDLGGSKQLLVKKPIFSTNFRAIL